MNSWASLLLTHKIAALFAFQEAYDVAIKELIFTIASGVVSLAVISFVLIPHWTASLIVTPMICITYINYLGKPRRWL